MKLTKTILWALLSEFIFNAAVLMGHFWCSTEWAVWAYIASAVLFVLMIAASFVMLARLSKDDKTDVEAAYRRAQDQKKEMEQDLAPEREFVLWLEARVWFAWVGTLAAMLAMGFFCGAAYESMEAVYILTATFVGFFCMPAVLSFGFCRPTLFSANPESELKRDVFPQLFALVDEAAAKMGYRRRYRIFLGEESIGVFRERRYDGILIPSILMELLTREELRQVLLHEFSHLTNPESDREVRWLRLIMRRDYANEYTSFSGIALMPVAVSVQAFEMAMNRYRMLAERVLEAEADRNALAGGNTAAAVAAIAKAGMYLRYLEEDRVSTFEIYRPGKPEKNLSSIRRRAFEKMLKERGKLWMEEMERELPSLFDSHPTFRQRREALGVKAYDPFSRETDGAWLAEAERLFEKADACHMCNPSYDRERRRLYIHRREDMEAFERAENPFETLEPEELCDAARAYYGLDDEKAKRILRQMIAREPKELLPKLMLGSWLLNERDEAGVEMLYEVAQNGNYTSSALQSIADYAYRSGRQDLVDEYEERLTGLLQKSMDFHLALDNVSFKDLGPRTISDGLLGELVDEMVRRGERNIAQIACAAKSLPGAEDAHVFVLKYVSDENEDLCEKIYARIFQLLDQREESYALLEDSSISIDKLEKRIPGSCVYVQK